MRRLSLALLLTATASLTAFACGGISDPTKPTGGERVATVSGALTGVSVPANAHVALVYRKAGGGIEVGGDSPVVAGKFSIGLTVPPDSYFDSLEGSGSSTGFTNNSGGSTPPSAGSGEPLPEPAPADPGSSSGASGSSSGGSSSGGGKPFAMPAFDKTITKKDSVSGGITQPLRAAVAGFIVYADTNGNGKLDFSGPNAVPTDTILGGNEDLILVYLKDGGALDYEKLRDRSGILPTTGFNLAWEEGRWLPLNVVELKLSPNETLPSPVCAYSGGDAPMPLPADPDTTPPSGGSSGTGSSSSGGSSGSSGGGAYPPPGAPGLRCSPDGRSYSYSEPCTLPPPEPAGLCGGGEDIAIGCAGIGGGGGLGPSDPVPPGWPCPVALDGGAADGGTPIDAGGAPDSGS